MADPIQQYIESGILEAYVIGSLSKNQELEVLRMKEQYPVVGKAIVEIEQDIEHIAAQMAIPPPPMLWNRIENELNGLVKTQEAEVRSFNESKQNYYENTSKPEQQYIEVEAQSEYIKVHRWWRYAFIAVFVIGKIFLATAIYFYIENKHNQQEVQELKARINQLENVRH